MRFIEISPLSRVGPEKPPQVDSCGGFFVALSAFGLLERAGFCCAIGLRPT
jgi:hypothetical protein